MEGQTREERPRAFYPDYTDHAPPARQPGWNLATERRLDDGRTLARNLGWFSIGLGLMEVLAPRRVTDFLGVDDSHASLVRFYGLREIASGVAILTDRTPTAGVMSRLGGDALDLATLGLALSRESDRPANVLTAMALVAGVTALDVQCARQLGETAADEARSEEQAQARRYHG